MPEPLRPTMPKNSPWRISKEMPSSAFSSRYSRGANGFTIRSLSESIRWVGIRKDFFRSSTWIATGRVGSLIEESAGAVAVMLSRGIAPRRVGETLAVSACCASGRRGASRRSCPEGDAIDFGRIGAALVDWWSRRRPRFAQDDDELDALTGGRFDVEGFVVALAAVDDHLQELGLRPDVHVDRVGGPFQLQRSIRDPLLEGLALRALGRLAIDDQPRPLLVVFGAASAPGPARCRRPCAPAGSAERRWSNV